MTCLLFQLFLLGSSNLPCLDPPENEKIKWAFNTFFFLCSPGITAMELHISTYSAGEVSCQNGLSYKRTARALCSPSTPPAAPARRADYILKQNGCQHVSCEPDQFKARNSYLQAG